ncbi:MAG: bifunctional proline dehydrogenase/L-glutamate gamma-semialdehyde dehydrogenase PutA [Woeseiaceae bacterium]|jgi:RHH-type proline utilization regulon transcriptional repressor/proline dehydrogenase/delta 1-pyrroline-5-carboxylate dehydrogenase|nr:bifunctional proline dehydrogenase/L-glutamate gamma-semialdehyde dehydrogenase PutA [Woeseiaceae bacterium]
MRFVDQPAAMPAAIPDLNNRYLADEESLVRELADIADPGDALRDKIRSTAAELVHAVRRNAEDDGGIEKFLQQYDLSSEEGVLLMCIAEALLRIPDADTADDLIADKITSASWRDHLGKSDSLFVNASTYGLMLTGDLFRIDARARRNPGAVLKSLVSRAGEPIVRTATRQAMRIMGHQFVMGRTIEEALKRSTRKDNARYRYSFDMLGEAALTRIDAERYMDAYFDAIGRVGDSLAGKPVDIFAAPSISVKLSALHPRYSYTQSERVLHELVPRVAELAKHAKANGIALTIDAEETERLEISLEIFAEICRDRDLANYDGLGLAVQTYQRRALDVLRFVETLATDTRRRIPVRLVKGAYWDTEIKHAQEQGLESYPVFTRKVHTDISYLAASRRALEAGDKLYPQFATHNAHTLASILHYAGSRRDYEFQRLHGMGEELYGEIVDPDRYGRPCRVYAPVGSHKDLLPYLVRRLLENGANTSFVNRIVDESVDVDDIVADPVTAARAAGFKPHPRIPAPGAMFDDRRNSAGINLPDRRVSSALLRAMDATLAKRWTAAPVIDGKTRSGSTVPSLNPSDHTDVVGDCILADAAMVDEAIGVAVRAQRPWDQSGGPARADILEAVADLYEKHGAELMGLCVREAGKTLFDALAELREAVDFLRYYAAEARRRFGDPVLLPGPTGERNTLGLRGRGVFVCISPWNFPLAIFTGQVAAALAAGNTVIAKPAEQTPLVAARAVRLFHAAGVPGGVLNLLPGDGAEVGGRAVADARIAGVAFTGSTETARVINRALAERDGPIATLIAETGGQNAMFVDSSALPEQVVLDSVMSAFNSAGQRCSALRLLCLQEDIADRVIELLKGHMDELEVGNPVHLATDVGPAIDAEARSVLEAHVERMTAEATLLHRTPVPETLSEGTFFAPTLIEISRIEQLEREVFGPILHVLRYKAERLEETIDAINATGYGLTMGLHSRIDARARALVARSGAGNIYINRNMVGAIVGVQPFGGRGLSGTGPKAGGPH